MRRYINQDEDEVLLFINIDLTAAVTSTSIGFKKLQFLLAAFDLSPLSESGMHQMSQTVCDKITQLSSDDRNEKLLQASGLEKNIHILVDTQYNISEIRNSRRTGLPTATQSKTLAMEKQTGKKYIVSHSHKTKCVPKERSWEAEEVKLLPVLVVTQAASPMSTN